MYGASIMCSFAGVVVPIYLGELAPPTLRGALGTLTQFGLVMGILASNLMAFPFATLTKWRYLFAVTPVLASVELMCIPFIFESPRCVSLRLSCLCAYFSCHGKTLLCVSVSVSVFHR